MPGYPLKNRLEFILSFLFLASVTTRKRFDNRGITVLHYNYHVTSSLEQLFPIVSVDEV